jgi:sec-independent protein translocase protein TatC
MKKKTIKVKKLPVPDESDLASMSLGDHLEELRYRLVMAIAGVLLGMVICLFMGRFLLDVIAEPFRIAMLQVGMEPQLQILEPAEKFLIYLKTSLIFGIIISSPWVIYHVWRFISAGLYRHERKYVYYVTPISAFLFITGCLFFLLVIGPISLKFFLGFDTGIEFVKVGITLTSYINFILRLTLIFGVAFQLPIAIVFAEKMGLVDVEMLTSIRKFVIVGLLIVSAMATPPDVVSQLALAIPLYILYEGSIVACRLTRKKE